MKKIFLFFLILCFPLILYAQTMGYPPHASSGVYGTIDLSDQPIVYVSTSSSIGKDMSQYSCDGTADDVQIQAAIDSLSSGGTVVLLEGTFTLTATLTGATNVNLIGQGKGLTILDISSIASGNAIEMGDYSTLKGIKVQGDISPLTTINKAVLAGNHSKIEDIWINENDYGIDCENKEDVHIYDYIATQIHDGNTEGWAACLHGSGTTNGIYGEGFYFDDCDRAFEFEDGAKNFHFKNGYLKTIKGRSGNYSFVLDAHSHSASGTVENGSYENFYCEDSDNIGAQGATAADSVKNISYKNITIVSGLPHLNGVFFIATYCEDIRVDGLRIYGVTPASGGPTIYVYPSAKKISLENIEYYDDQGLSFYLGGEDILIQGVRAAPVLAANGYSCDFSGTGKRILIKNVTALNATKYGAFQVIGTNFTGPVTFEDMKAVMAGSGPGWYGFSLYQCDSKVRFIRPKFFGTSSTLPFEMESCTGIIFENPYTQASNHTNGPMKFDSGCSNLQVFNPNFDGTVKAIVDLGTNNQIYIPGGLQGTTGGWSLQKAESTVTLSGASGTITLSIPTNAKLDSVQLRVDTAITSGDGAATWNAAFVTGCATTITTGQAFTKNTKVNFIYDASVASPITTDTTNIIITPDAHTFSGGVVRAIAYYLVNTAMVDN